MIEIDIRPLSYAESHLYHTILALEECDRKKKKELPFDMMSRHELFKIRGLHDDFVEARPLNYEEI